MEFGVFSLQYRDLFDFGFYVEDIYDLVRGLGDRPSS